MKENLKPCVYKLWKDYVYEFTHHHDRPYHYDRSCGVSFLGVGDYACESFLASSAILASSVRGDERTHRQFNRVLFVERSGELR